MLLVRAAESGDWSPSSSLGIVRLEIQGNDPRGLYEALGVEPTASQEEIRAAAKRRMLECHPDVGGDEDEFEDVLDAYRTLSDPAARAEYDSEEPEAEETILFATEGTPLRSDESDSEAPKGPEWYKRPSELLNDEDRALVARWRELVLETAREMRVDVVVKVGIAGKIEGDYRADVALVRRGAQPTRLEARAAVLRLMTTRESEKLQ